MALEPASLGGPGGWNWQSSDRGEASGGHPVGAVVNGWEWTGERWFPSGGSGNPNYSLIYGGGGGGGAGGSIIIKSQTATLGSTLLTATGGNGGNGGGSPGNGGGNGGAGGTGRIHLDYLSSYTGTTNPSLNVTQDFSLADKGGSFLFLMT